MLLFDPNDPSSFEKAHAVGERMALRAIELDGTCTGEHGIGLGTYSNTGTKDVTAIQN